MARGWESKSVEEQQAESIRQPGSGAALTPQEAEAQRKRELLIMARKRVAGQLQQTSNERYRKLLEQELQALDDQLAAA